MHGLAVALYWAARLYLNERHPSEVERLTSELIELSTRQNFPHWLALGTALRGWARSASGDTEEGLAWIEGGIEDWVATGAVLQVPYYLGLKSEALYLADRTSEALEAISEAEALVERFEDRHWSAELPDSAVCFWRLSVLTRRKLRLRSAKPLEPERSRNRFR